MVITLFELILVSLGGIAGSLLRWQFMEALPTPSIAVFAVNQLGVLVAGFVAYRMSASDHQKRFWINGFAGGFTTLSSLAFILHGSSPIRGAGFALASILTSLLILNLLKDKAKS